MRLLLVVIGVIHFEVIAQPLPKSHHAEFLLQVYRHDDGLPHNTVSAIAQSSDGYLWIGTHNGLARFDGNKFTTFLAKKNPGLGSDHVDCLNADPRGPLWIGLERGGVSELTGGVFRQVAPLSAFTNRLNTLNVSSDGNLWVGYSVGRLLRWSDNQWKSFADSVGFPAHGRVFTQMDTDGRLWFASDNSYGYFEDDVCMPLATNRLEFFRVASRSEGGVWLVRGRELLQVNADFETTSVTSLEALGEAGIEVIFEDSTEALWLGTRGNGLFRFADGKLTRMPTSHDFILAICEDTEGDIWVGTWGGGLNRLHPKLLRTYGAVEGLSKSLLLSLCEDNQGAVWIAARGGPPVSIPADRSENIVTRSGWPAALANALCADRAGGVWLASEQRGLFHWNLDSYTQAGFQGTFIMSLFQDSHTNLWIGTLRDGLFELKPGLLPQLRGGDELREITAITEDSAGTIWAGTQKGTLHRKRAGENTFTNFNETNDLPGQKLQAIFADGPDSLWIGTRGGGIIRLKNGKITVITASQGIPDDDIRQIIADDDGGLWIGTGKGLFHTRAMDLDAAAKDSKLIVECVALGKSHGLDNYEFQEGFRNASCKTRDGHLWFATTRGAIEVDPRREIFQHVPPPVHIEEILVDGKPLPMRGDAPIEISPDPGRVEIRYTAVSFSAPENIRFRHRLEGLENEWTEDGDQRSVVFFRMTPGSYQFRVIARGSSGNWNLQGASVVFIVRATLWETLWFRVAIIAVSLFLMGAAVRIILLRRIRRRLRELEQAQALENERRRIARDMHDELGASLTRLGLMSEQIRRHPGIAPDAAAKARRLAETTTEVVQTLDQIVWTVNPGNDTLERLIGYLSHHATDFLANTSIRLTQELPQINTEYNVGSDLRHQLFLTFKEALNNTVKHSAATEVKLRIGLDNHTLIVVVEDNGKGFVMQNETGKGDGLITLQTRLNRIGGACQIETAPGHGTRVTLNMPLPPTDA